MRRAFHEPSVLKGIICHGMWLIAPTPELVRGRPVVAHNNLLGFPYRHGFTVRSMALLLEDTGFNVVRIHGDALVPIADEWTRGWAAAEERMITAAMKTLAALDRDGAPWFEVYAKRDG